MLESLTASVETMAATFQKDRKRMIQRFEIQRRATTGAEPGDRREQFQALVYDLVMEREQGQPDCELRARLVTGLLTMVQSVANDYWLAHGGDDDLHEVGTHCVALLSKMLLGDRALLSEPAPIARAASSAPPVPKYHVEHRSKLPIIENTHPPPTN